MRPRPTPAWVLLAYLIAGICFILALRGLSSPESSRRGNRSRHVRHGDRGGHDARPLPAARRVALGLLRSTGR